MKLAHEKVTVLSSRSRRFLKGILLVFSLTATIGAAQTPEDSINKQAPANKPTEEGTLPAKSSGIYSPTPTAARTQDVRLGIKADCLLNLNLKKGAKNECLKISGIKLTFISQADHNFTSLVTLDPFAMPSRQYQDNLLSGGIDLQNAKPFGFLSDYQFAWHARPGLDLAVESYKGSTWMLSDFQFYLTPPLVDTGWQQTALTAHYLLGENGNYRIKFAAGNGEGEDTINKDIQQFIGFEFQGEVLKGAWLKIGASFDGNNLGSSEFEYHQTQLQKNCGITPIAVEGERGASTQRQSLSLMLDPQFEYAKQIRFWAGWHRAVASDLNRNFNFSQSSEQLDGCGDINIDELFIEDSTHDRANRMTRTVLQSGLAYTIKGKYTVAAEYKSRTVESEEPFFQECVSIEGTSCVKAGESIGKLNQAGWVAALSTEVTAGLIAQVEYSILNYNRLYQHFYYMKDGNPNKEAEYFNFHISYLWH